MLRDAFLGGAKVLHGSFRVHARIQDQSGAKMIFMFPMYGKYVDIQLLFLSLIYQTALKFYIFTVFWQAERWLMSVYFPYIERTKPILEPLCCSQMFKVTFSRKCENDCQEHILNFEWLRKRIWFRLLFLWHQKLKLKLKENSQNQKYLMWSQKTTYVVSAVKVVCKVIVRILVARPIVKIR